MKKTTLLLLSGLLLLCLGFTAGEDWYNYRSVELGFRIEFPEKPTQSTQEIPSELGPLTLNMSSYQPEPGEDDNLVYLTNLTEYPGQDIHSDSTSKLDNIYQGAMNGAAQNVGGRIISQSTIQLGKYEGRDFKVDYAQGQAIIRMRMFLVQNRMYMMQVISETEKVDNPSMLRFLDSFSLL